jgi:pyruvate,orthophosphate dikinase
VKKITKAVSASPGAAVGKAVFDSATAVRQAAAGEEVILVRRETNPDDLHGMIAAQGILTSRGGKTSHAAVVARGMGKTCVCGADELEVDLAGRKFTAPGGITVSEGDVISIDGTSGVVYIGEVPVMASPVVEFFEGSLDSVSTRTPTPATTVLGPAGSARAASAWCGPSTCSSASAASWWSG